MKTSPVVIVSAFGRGQSLAVRLKAADIPVVLVDVSESLGATAPEDEEGPFGLFLTGLSEIEKERIHQDDPLVNQDSGWTFVLKNGPFSLKSPTTKMRMTKMGLSPDSFEILREWREGKSRDLDVWMKAGFEKAWLVEFAMSLAANHFDPQEMPWGSGYVLPLDEEFSIRPATRPGLLQSLAWAERQGVEVHRDYVLMDLASEGKAKVKGLQFRARATKASEILSFEKLIWCLSSEETASLSEGILEKIFPDGALKPSWVWTRFRYRIPPSLEREVLPFHSVWIPDLDLPWTHENLVILQKSPSPDLVDAWIRVPADQRLQKKYMNERHDQVLEMLTKKFVTVKPLKSDELHAGERTLKEMGPTRQPLFNRQSLLNWRGPRDRNISFHAPEVWQGLGWNALFQHEKKLFTQTEQWWKKREEMRIKKEMKLKGKSS